MQFNPTAIELSLTMASPSTVDWINHFRSILTVRHGSADPEVLAVAPDVSSALTEIWSIFEVVRHSWHPIWAWTSLSWHEGPQFTALLQTLQALSIANDANSTAKLLRLPYVQRYLRLISEGDIQWIHPLWTLATRIWLQMHLFVVPELTSTDSLSSAMGWVMNKLSAVPDEILISEIETKLHLQHIYRVLCPDASSPPTQQDYIKAYFKTIEYRSFTYTISMAVNGSDVAEASSYCRLSMYNLCTALIICSNDNMDISKSTWPEETSVLGCTLSRFYSTAAEAAFCAACLEGFIAAYVKGCGGLATPKASGFAVFFISNAVTSVPRSYVPAIKNRGKELATCTVAMVEASEAPKQ